MSAAIRIGDATALRSRDSASLPRLSLAPEGVTSSCQPSLPASTNRSKRPGLATATVPSRSAPFVCSSPMRTRAGGSGWQARKGPDSRRRWPGGLTRRPRTRSARAAKARCGAIRRASRWVSEAVARRSQPQTRVRRHQQWQPAAGGSSPSRPQRADPERVGLLFGLRSISSAAGRRAPRRCRPPQS